jgi:putative transposase
VLCDKRFTFAYIFAAVGPGTDNAFALVMPYADTAPMQSFLDHFSETLAEDEHAVMVLDQAAWHVANALAVPANWVPLPPSSPELNVWLHLKQRFFSHRLLSDYDAIVDAACNARNRFVAETSRTKSLRSYPGFQRSMFRLAVRNLDAIPQSADLPTMLPASAVAHRLRSAYVYDPRIVMRVQLIIEDIGKWPYSPERAPPHNCHAAPFLNKVRLMAAEA